jgi:PBP1b-binding outer membrane lipoprotein LpoB
MDVKILISGLLAVSLLLSGCTGQMEQKDAQEEQAKNIKFIFLGTGANDSPAIQTIIVNSSGKNFSSAVTEAIETYENQIPIPENDSSANSENVSDMLPPGLPLD